MSFVTRVMPAAYGTKSHSVVMVPETWGASLPLFVAFDISGEDFA